MTADALRVAVDVGPLHGAHTGVSNSIVWTLDAIDDRCRRGSEPHLGVVRYLTSVRSRTGHGERRIPLPGSWAQWLWAQRWSPPVDRLVGRPDVVHGTNYVVPRAHAARVVTVHDCWFLEHPQHADPALGRVADLLRRAIGEGAHVVTPSDAVTERVRALFDTRSVTTVPHGPPPAPSEPIGTPPPTGDPQRPFVLALGTVERRKNLVTLIDAFGAVAQAVPTVDLRLAGRDGDDAPAVARAIDRLPVEARRRVIRHADVDDATKQWLLQHAAALAYPSLDEGFGFPILEAQQAGVPVVASSAGSIPEVAGEGALLCDPLDTGSLAEHLSTVLTVDSVNDRLVSNGRRNLTRFSWEHTADELVALYHRVAAGA